MTRTCPTCGSDAPTIRKDLYGITSGVVRPCHDSFHPRLPSEVDRLRKWKREALRVLAEWEKVFEALGSPGELGDSKPAAVLAEIARREEKYERGKAMYIRQAELNGESAAAAIADYEKKRREESGR